jgi:hypothetical protein
MPFIWPVQAPPVWQLPPAQQAAPIAPQLVQLEGMPPPGALQPSPELQLAPAQQTWPDAPHCSHEVITAPSFMAA